MDGGRTSEGYRLLGQGLHTLEEGGLRTTLINAVETATKRAKELGRGGK